MMHALQGTPAGNALAPPRKGTWVEALAQFAQAMGMALPGRGGMGPVRPRSPAQQKAYEDLIEQGFKNWVRENVVGKTLPKGDVRTTGEWQGPVPVSEVIPPGTSEQALWNVLLTELMGQGIQKKVPGQGSSAFPSGVTPSSLPPSSQTWQRGLVPGMPLLQSTPSTVSSIRLGQETARAGQSRPIFWPVD